MIIYMPQTIQYMMDLKMDSVVENLLKTGTTKKVGDIPYLVIL